MNNKYQEILQNINSLIDINVPLVSNLSNVSSILYNLGDISWAGFYLANESNLYLGPFQGEVACTLIPFSKGVCGTSYSKKETIIVDNVHLFEGHIACSNKSNSEIVTPILKDHQAVGVIDLDSEKYSRFDLEIKELLEQVAGLLSKLF